MIAQLGERQTEDLKVPGSIPGRGIVLHHIRLPISNEPLQRMKTLNYLLAFHSILVTWFLVVIIM